MLYCRHSAGERDAQNELNNRILVQRNSRRIIVEWKRVAQDLGDRSLQVTNKLVVLCALLQRETEEEGKSERYGKGERERKRQRDRDRD